MVWTLDATPQMHEVLGTAKPHESLRSCEKQRVGHASNAALVLPFDGENVQG